MKDLGCIPTMEHPPSFRGTGAVGLWALWPNVNKEKKAR